MVNLAIIFKKGASIALAATRWVSDNPEAANKAINTTQRAYSATKQAVQSVKVNRASQRASAQQYAHEHNSAHAQSTPSSKPPKGGLRQMPGKILEARGNLAIFAGNALSNLPVASWMGGAVKAGGAAEKAAGQSIQDGNSRRSKQTLATELPAATINAIPGGKWVDAAFGVSGKVTDKITGGEEVKDGPASAPLTPPLSKQLISHPAQAQGGDNKAAAVVPVQVAEVADAAAHPRRTPDELYAAMKDALPLEAKAALNASQQDATIPGGPAHPATIAAHNQSKDPVTLGK